MAKNWLAGKTCCRLLHPTSSSSCHSEAQRERAKRRRRPLVEWGEDAAWEEQQAKGGIGRRRSVVGDSHSFVRERGAETDTLMSHSYNFPVSPDPPPQPLLKAPATEQRQCSKVLFNFSQNWSQFHLAVHYRQFLLLFFWAVAWTFHFSGICFGKARKSSFW